MNREFLLGEVRSMLHEFGGVDPDLVDEQTAFVADLGLDSLVLVRMTVHAEERFGIRIPDEDAWELHTVGAVIGYVEQTVARQQSGAVGE